jgi:hypothetical protein
MSVMDLSEENKKLYDGMITEFSLRLHPSFNASKITMLIATGIKYLAKVKGLSGLEKKKLVIYGVKDVILKSESISVSDKAHYTILVDMVGNTAIDVLVDFAKNAYIYVDDNCCKPKRTATATRSLSGNEDCKQRLKIYIGLILQRPVSPQHLVTVLAASVKYMSQYSALSGSEKKAVVINAVTETVNQLEMDAEDKGVLLELIDLTADSTIDYLVDFSKRLYLRSRRCPLFCFRK